MTLVKVSLQGQIQKLWKGLGAPNRQFWKGGPGFVKFGKGGLELVIIFGKGVPGTGSFGKGGQVLSILE